VPRRISTRRKRSAVDATVPVRVSLREVVVVVVTTFPLRVLDELAAKTNAVPSAVNIGSKMFPIPPGGGATSTSLARFACTMRMALD